MVLRSVKIDHVARPDALGIAVPKGIIHDGQQPGPTVCAWRELVEKAKRAQECFLEQVGRVVWIPRQGQAGRIQMILMRKRPLLEESVFLLLLFAVGHARHRYHKPRGRASPVGPPQVRINSKMKTFLPPSYVFPAKQIGWCDTNKNLARHAIALAVGFRLILAHIPAVDAGGPIEELVWVCTHTDCAFELDNRKWWELIVNAQTDARISPEVGCFDSLMPSSEHKSLVVNIKPNRHHMRPPVSANGCALRGADKGCAENPNIRVWPCFSYILRYRRTHYGPSDYFLNSQSLDCYRKNNDDVGDGNDHMALRTRR